MRTLSQKDGAVPAACRAGRPGGAGGGGRGAGDGRDRGEDEHILYEISRFRKDFQISPKISGFQRRFTKDFRRFQARCIYEISAKVTTCRSYFVAHAH